MTAAQMLIAAEGGHEIVNELPFDPVFFGVIALVVFAALLGVLWTFRNSLALDPHGIAEHDDPDTSVGSGSATKHANHGGGHH